MTKTEFGNQFKRLRASGYHLVLPDGITLPEVVDEWYRTFGACSVAELAHAIDCLKRTKLDTFWPAPGELWAPIFQYRKERRIQAEARNGGGEDDPTAPDQRQEFQAAFQAFRDRLLAKMTMPEATVQVEPEHVREEADAEQDE